MIGLRLWFRDFFRPKVTRVYVLLFENGTQKEIGSYDSNRLRVLMNTIDSLWEVPTGTPYWFETECIEEGGCFHKRRTYLQVSCYTNTDSHKVPMEIPVRYRKKLFDKAFGLNPSLFSNINWPKKVSVRFVINTTKLDV